MPTNMPHTKAFLIVNNQVFTLEAGTTTIGRQLDNDLVIHDPRISRQHAEVIVDTGSFAITDLDSTGGTFVNGQKIRRTILYSGDTISLAGVPIIFVQDAPKLVDKTQKHTGPLRPRHFIDTPTIARKDLPNSFD